jgi:hypothetical protein
MEVTIIGHLPEIGEVMAKNYQSRLAAGTNLADCKKFARSLGCAVDTVRGTGELRFIHQSVPGSVRVDHRRKDAPRALTTWLNHLAAILRAIRRTAK